MLDGVPLGQLGIEGINDAQSLTVLDAVTFTPDLPPVDTNSTGHRPVPTHWIPHRCSQKLQSSDAGGGVAFGHGMTFSNLQMSPTTTGYIQEGNELEEGQQGTAGEATTIFYTFIFSQAHLLMLESTPYFLKSATFLSTTLLSTTGYCWKAGEMSAQQARVLSTKRKTFVACTRNHPSAEERPTRWRARPTDMRAQPVSQLGSKTTSSHPHLTGAPLPPFSSTPPRAG